MKSFINKNFLFACIFIGLVLHIISSYFTVGFYSDDEHFQILEITAYLLGINEIAIEDTTGYYWEWREHIRMRPWLQPYIYYQIITFLKIFGFNDPFAWTLFIRLISSIIGYLSVIFLFFSLKDYFFKKNYKFNTLIFFTFWFYPFLHSRTSSENLSITLFLISFCILYNMIIKKNYKINYLIFILASFLMGISMVVKFNLVFTTIPFFFWFLVYRFNFYLLTIFCLLIILSLSLGLYVDYIHWGSFRNTYYQFYYYNLDETLGRLNEFGVESWYYYITETIKQLAPLLSIFFVFSIVFYWIKNPKEIISWITFITFVAFTFIGHKEIRYIFPIYIFAPLFIAYLLDYIKSKNIKKCFMIIIIFSNIIFLSLTLFFPPNSKVGIYKFIYNNVTHDSKIYYSKENPYLVNNMEPFLYTKFLPNIKKINYEILPKKNFWLATNSYNDIDNIIGHNCRIIFSNYPLKIINLNQNWKRLKINWYIFKCIKN